MTNPTPKPDERPSPLLTPGLRDYVFLGLAAALSLFLALSVHSFLVPAVMVGLLAVAGLLARFTISPGLVIVMTGYLMVDPYLNILADTGARAWRPGRIAEDMAFGITDVVVIVALLAYLIAQYRVYSLLNHSIPTVRRPRRLTPARGIGRGKRPSARRPGSHVRESEFRWLFVAAVAAMIVGQLFALSLYALVPEESRFGRADLGERLDRTAALLWIVILGGTILTAVAGYLRMRRTKPDVALQLLEDTVWNESHREQTRLRRWVAWRHWWHRD